MRRSRSLTFKKEQEQKQSQSQPQSQPQRQQPPRLKSPPPQLNRPQQTKINYQSQPQSHEVEDSDNDDVPLSKVSHSSKQSLKKQPPPSKPEEEEEEEHDYEDDDHYDQEEEEEEQLPPPPKTRPSSAKSKQTINLSTQKDQEEQSSPSKQRGRSPGRKPAPATSPKSRPVQQEEENHEQEDDEEVRESKEGSGDKRKRLIISKILFQKLLSTCEIESTTSDIINHTEADLIEYVQDVIKVISNNEEDDEVVVRDSSLKFLGDKSKAQGLLDQKTFDKIFQEAIANVSTNITFTSEAYKSLCKYTEVHVLDMLTKVKAIMKHSGRKRLNTSDVELLKFILE